MKYLVACLLILGLVGCGQGHGPDTGWECPDCGWGVSASAKECPECGADLQIFSAKRRGGSAGDRKKSTVGQSRLGLTPDPIQKNLDPRQFMIDLVTSIRGFNDLLESIEDEEAFAVTEVAFADFVEEMENIANRSMGHIDEPKEEEREELYAMLGDIVTEVVRLKKIGQQKRSDRELWNQIDPHYSRFNAAMRMVPMIPPAGMPEDPATP